MNIQVKMKFPGGWGLKAKNETSMGCGWIFSGIVQYNIVVFKFPNKTKLLLNK